MGGEIEISRAVLTPIPLQVGAGGKGGTARASPCLGGEGESVKGDWPMIMLFRNKWAKQLAKLMLHQPKLVQKFDLIPLHLFPDDFSVPCLDDEHARPTDPLA